MTANKFSNQLTPALADLGKDFPFLVDAAMSFAIGDVWGRTEIDDKSRELAMVAALGALGAGGYVQLRQHASFALTFGATADELRELVYLTTVSAGFPRALNMAAEVKAVLDEAGIAARTSIDAHAGSARWPCSAGWPRSTSPGIPSLARLTGLPVPHRRGDRLLHGRCLDAKRA